MSLVTFNGVAIPSFVKVRRIEFSVLPELSVQYQELPRTFGGSFLYTQKGTKKFSLDIFIEMPEGRVLFDCAEEFGDWLQGDNYKPSRLEFNEMPDCYFMANVNGAVNVSDILVAGEGSVEFLAVDPSKYSTKGLEVSGNSPLTVNYSGKVEQPFTVTFTVPQESTLLGITNTSTNKTMRLKGTFKQGDTVTFDTSKKQVIYNNQINMRLLSIDSEWLSLVKGVNVLRLTVNNSASTAVLNVSSKIAF
ncbi:distal tail protein Dit [Enterococcus entomosocium]|uniref:distal tail protein Dit n=1 Tax=Enterococcus entomosocium TaxID=3034352 RepID=UPI002648ADD8|nr:distal tail protein Dit [Enterococcus entomosocium]